MEFTIDIVLFLGLLFALIGVFFFYLEQRFGPSRTLLIGTAFTLIIGVLLTVGAVLASLNANHGVSLY